ncbi:MAG TPA: hypothetical protein VK388_08475 [Pyrinomonadaceae bacterium]|nr:hypothetical protein [Pyrinomonadaceae bacterium]
MSEKLRVSFNSPQCGWMSFELRAGERSLAEAVSCAPYDSLVDLINALVKLLRDDVELTIKWAHDPDELDFKFSAGGDEARLEVDWYRDSVRDGATGERVFTFEGSRLDVCYPFWKALSDLQADIEVDEFARNWRREFPAREMLRLTEEIEAEKQKQPRRAELSAS